MVKHFSFYICLVILNLSSLTSSCQLPYRDDVNYLSYDSTYQTSEQKQKFVELRSKFLQQWNDTSNCYVEKPSCLKCRWMVEWQYQREINISNILHTSNYDTLLALITWYSAEYDSSGKVIEDRTVAIGMGAVTDAFSNWQFRCEGGTYRLTGSKNQEINARKWKVS
jgi:hypothetical protein